MVGGISFLMIVEFNSSQRPERRHHLRLAPCAGEAASGRWLSLGCAALGGTGLWQTDRHPLFVFSYLLGSHCSMFLSAVEETEKCAQGGKVR